MGSYTMLSEVCVHTYIHTYIHICIYLYIHAYMYTPCYVEYAHIYIHTYIHVCTYQHVCIRSDERLKVYLGRLQLGLRIGEKCGED